MTFTRSAYISWILVLVAPFTFGVALVAAWLLSYWPTRATPPEYIIAHRQAVRMLFCWTLFWSVIGCILTMLWVGWLILAVLVLWLWYHAVRGLKALDAQQSPFRQY